MLFLPSVIFVLSIINNQYFYYFVSSISNTALFLVVFRKKLDFYCAFKSMQTGLSPKWANV
jgi:hypothetical protein